MRRLKPLLFFFSILFSAATLAQNKIVSTETKDTIHDTRIVICVPSRSAALEPLYILDGKVTDHKILSRIKPADIENIKVVKGDEAKSLYGDKGTNGVIIITRKK